MIVAVVLVGVIIAVLVAMVFTVVVAVVAVLIDGPGGGHAGSAHDDEGKHEREDRTLPTVVHFRDGFGTTSHEGLLVERLLCRVAALI